MSPLLDGFRLDATPPPEPPPKVLVRILTAQPGLPWDQTKAAMLDARHGSPIPLADVSLQLRRLAPWSPGAEGRFAALYAPTRIIGERLRTTVFIKGSPVEVEFLSPGAQAAARKRLLFVAAGAAVFVAVTISAVGEMLSRKDEAEIQLSALETQSASRARAVALQQRQLEQSRALDAVRDRGAPLDRVLSDLAAVSAMQAPAAQVVGVHWQDGAVALEARGKSSPLSSNRGWSVEHSDKSIRRGVGLWVLTPAGAASGQGRPVSADLKDGGA